MTPTDLLAFESRWPSHTTEKWIAIRDVLGISEVRYYQLLIRAARSLEGVAAHPVTARMVRERAGWRAARRAARGASTG